MALDVGVVTIDYSAARPSGAAGRYAHTLIDYEDIEGSYWKVEAAWNTFLELERNAIVSHARGYVEANSLTEPEAAEVMGWVNSLPWEDNRVMLHLGRH